MFSRFSSNKVAKAGGFVAANESGKTARGGDAEVLEDAPTWRSSSEFTNLKVTLHQRLLDMLNLSVIDKMAPEDFRREIGEMVRELLVEENRPLNLNERNQLVDDILDEVLGLGPLEPLLKDNSVTDIMNACGLFACTSTVASRCNSEKSHAAATDGRTQHPPLCP